MTALTFHAYLSVHFIMYANIKSICSTPDANIYVRNISVFKGNMFYVEDKKMLLY